MLRTFLSSHGCRKSRCSAVEACMRCRQPLQSMIALRTCPCLLANGPILCRSGTSAWSRTGGATRRLTQASARLSPTARASLGKVRGPHVSFKVQLSRHLLSLASPAAAWSWCSRAEYPLASLRSATLCLSTSPCSCWMRILEQASTFHPLLPLPAARVLDVGAGSGLLSMMAARAGASHVWAIERIKPMASVAAKIISANGYAATIQVLNADSSKLGPADLLQGAALGGGQEGGPQGAAGQLTAAGAPQGEAGQRPTLAAAAAVAEQLPNLMVSEVRPFKHLVATQITAWLACKTPPYTPPPCSVTCLSQAPSGHDLSHPTFPHLTSHLTPHLISHHPDL